MKSLKTLILTNTPTHWQNYYSNLNDNNHVIIEDENIDPSKLKKIKELDLLIMHAIPFEKHLNLFQRLSQHAHIKSTFVLPPGYSESYLQDGIDVLQKTIHPREALDLSLDSPVASLPVHRTNEHQPEGTELHMSGFMLGSFRVLVNGLGVHEWQGRKAKSLLAYLLYNRKFANSREIIMDKFWPNVSPHAARNSLNGIIHKIRRLLKRKDPQNEYILYKEDRYLLNPELDIELDYESFLSSFKTGQSLERNHSFEKAIQYYEEATRLYKGDFLQDNIYDEWTYSERESFKQKYLHALDRLSTHYLSQQKYLLAQQYCRKMLDKDDCLEAVHRRLMKCLYKNGYRDLAVKQFHKCAESLKKGLDINPGLQTTDLLQLIIDDAV